MLIEAVMVMAMSGVAMHADDQRSLVLPVGRMVATPRVYPAGRADDVHRPGFNGRAWIGRTARSRAGDGGHPEYALDWRSPGPAAYGAAEDDGSTAYIRIGHNIVGISPWETQSFSRLEEGRRQWLDERGYTGGVRTFVSDAAMRLARADEAGNGEPLAVKPAADRSDPEPRVILELPEDMPRQKSRMRVDAGEKPAVKTIGTQPTPRTAHRPSVVHVPSTPAAEATGEQVADARPR